MTAAADAPAAVETLNAEGLTALHHAAKRVTQQQHKRCWMTMQQ
jgi:hypothetical protein